VTSRRMLLINIVIIVVIIAAGFIGYYFYNQSTLYLSTDNASVTGQAISVASPAAGQITSWSGTEGQQFTSGQTIGQVAVGPGKTVSITMPDNGTIVQNAAIKNEFVGAGTPLAEAYNMQNLWVTANIKETQISNVKVGQAVDVYVDAFPGITIKGTVDQIGLATASTFSLLPSTNDNANFTKVTQVVPVKITLQGDEGIGLVPGMSATVRIHK